MHDMYLEPIYSIHEVVWELHLKRGGGVPSSCQDCDPPPWLSSGQRSSAPSSKSPGSCSWPGRHHHLHLHHHHVLHLAVKAEIDRHPDAVTPALVPLLVPVPESVLVVLMTLSHHITWDEWCRPGGCPSAGCWTCRSGACSTSPRRPPPPGRI